VKIGEYAQLLTGVPKLAVKQVDLFKEINFTGPKENLRISFRYNKDLEQNVTYLIDNTTGKVVKKSPSDAQVDHMIRIKRMMGLYIDKQA